MKARYISLIVIWLALISSFPVQASKEKKKKKQCETCFTSEVTSISCKSDHCTEYEIVVSYDGQCKNSLSHYTISIPRCASLKSSQHTSRCSHGLKYDPVTGLTGIIVDDLDYFGKTHKKSFKVSFALCGNPAKCKSLKNWQPVVAYATKDCYELDTLETTPPPPTPAPDSLRAHISKTDASCSDSSDGSAEVTVDVGTPPFSYLWSSGDTTSIIQNLRAGTYTVNVTDADENTLSLSTEIHARAPIILVSTVVNSNCTSQSNGAIDISVTGGAGAPNAYLWSNGATTEDLASLRAGTYSVTVSDSTGCTAKATYTVGNSKQLVVSVAQVQPACSQDNGSLTINVSGGTEPYTYLWGTGATTASINNLSPGLFSYTVTDALGCSISRVQILREENTLKTSNIVTPTSCLDDNSGAIDVTVTGGTGPYAYYWSSGDTSEDLDSLAGGTYALTVTDSAGCETTSNISVFKSSYQVNAVVVQPKCLGDDTKGSISVTPAGGAEPHTYMWSTGATTSSIDNLLAGPYSVTVTDASGCSRLLAFSIVAPTQLKATHVSTRTSCGLYKIDLSTTGGKPPYQYAWSNGALTQDLLDVSAATYSVVVTDANNCSLTHEAVIAPTPSWTCLITPPAALPACSSTANLITSAVPGAASYLWELTSSDSSWSIQGGATTGTVMYTAGNQNSSAIFNLTVVKDGCTQTCNFTVTTCTTPGSPPVDPPGHQTCSYPNPFRDWCDFDVTCDDDDDIEIEIFDQYGKRVCEPIRDHFSRGEKKTFRIDGSLLKEKLYVYRVRGKNKNSYGKLFRAD